MRNINIYVLTREDVIEASNIVGSHEFVMTWPNGYDTILEESGANISVGQRQLLSFARALLLDSKIFILDEATSYIDSYTERQIQNALDRVLENRTGIIIAHRLSTIKNADKIIVLNKGEIVEIGSHEKLLSNKNLYWKLWVIMNHHLMIWARTFFFDFHLFSNLNSSIF